MDHTQQQLTDEPYFNTGVGTDEGDDIYEAAVVPPITPSDR